MHEDDRSKRASIAGIRHELRTPINAIIGYSEMLLEDSQADELDSFAVDLTRVLAAGKTTLSLVEEILDPSALSESRIELDLDAFEKRMRESLRNPLNIIIGYSEMLIEEAQESGKTEYVADLAKIKEAANRLLALINDLIKVSEIEAGKIELDLRRGVPSEMVDDVITTMRRLESGSGTERSIYGKILVADDNETNRDLLSRYLEREGHSIDVAFDGDMAAEMIARVAYDLIFLDVMMPGLNGLQVLERIKSNDDTRDIPVIMISALNEIESDARCVEMGAEDYLFKPFNPVLLKARTIACLEKKRLRDREVLYLRQIEDERKHSDELLHVILPHEIAEELKRSSRVKPRKREGVAVLFVDVVDFTPFCEEHRPEEVVFHLQEMIDAFEKLSLANGLLKIKTIGDAFMATSGLLTEVDNTVLECVECGLAMLEEIQTLSANWQARVGIHTGPVMAGVVGNRQYSFDVWGDTVNTAARVESHGLAGRVNISADAWAEVAGICEGESQGLIDVKGKGPMEIYRIDRVTRSEVNQS